MNWKYKTKPVCREFEISNEESTSMTWWLGRKWSGWTKQRPEQVVLCKP
jgi:hypothetical protein